MRLMWVYSTLAVLMAFDVWAVWRLIRAFLGSQETLDLEFRLRVDDRVSITGKRTRETRYARAH